MTPGPPPLLGPGPLLLVGGAVVGGLALLAVGARRRGAARGLAVGAGSLLVTAALVEGGVRGAIARGSLLDERGGDLYADDLRIDGATVPRHVLAVAPGPHPDRARIVALGDSFTHGEGVRPTEAFPALLSGLVHPADGRPVEVANLGIAGLDAADEHQLFLAYGQALVPDVVVWTLVPNDLGGGWLDGVEGYDDLVLAPPPSPASSCVACGLLARGVRAWRLEDDVVASYRASFSPAALDALEARFRDVAGAVHDQGGRLLVVTFPLLWRLDELPFADLHAGVLARARAAGAEVLDLGPTFAGRDEASLWSTPRDHHPNAAAHVLAAEAIAAAIGTGVPTAHAATCHSGAGDAVRAACTTRGAPAVRAWADDLTRPRADGGPSAGRLRPFALAWAATLGTEP